MTELFIWKKIGKLLNFHVQNDLSSMNSLGLSNENWDEFENLIKLSVSKNGWFTDDNIREALKQISIWISSKEFDELFYQYFNPDNSEKTIAIIMAGNIPLVGFHDFMCSLISGFSVNCKLSSDDNYLLKGIATYINVLDAKLGSRIKFSDRNLFGFNGIIATGSKTSNKSFNSYFGEKYHLFRSHRTSVAVIEGNESDLELQLLGKDMFQYFGKGCRSVPHICFPINFDIQRVFKNIISYSDVINNKKYGNNYDYNKAILLMDLEKILDNNFVIFRESLSLYSSISVIHYHFYNNEHDLNDYLEKNKSNIQCVVGKNYMPFGTTQCPSIDDFADGVNTLEWLRKVP